MNFAHKNVYMNKIYWNLDSFPIIIDQPFGIIYTL